MSLALLRHPRYVTLNSFIRQQQLLRIEGSRQLFFIRDYPVNSLMALPTNTDSPVRHILFGKPLQKILLPVHCAGNEVVFGQRLCPLTEHAVP